MVQDLVFLRLLYPRLVVWFDWFNTSQVSGSLGRWGVYAVHCLGECVLYVDPLGEHVL